MKRRCGKCGNPGLAAVKHTIKRELDGRTFSGDVTATRCEACGETLVPGPAALAFERAVVADLARGDVGPQSFRFLRRAAGLQAARLAELLDVTPGTVSRWENGKKPLERRAVALVVALALEAQEKRTTTRELLERLASKRKPSKRVVLGLREEGTSYRATLERTGKTSGHAERSMRTDVKHPSATYARPYETAESIFGKEMSAAELIDRVRGFSWNGAYYRLACLAAVVANEGVLSDRVRRLTVDPIVTLTGPAGDLLARGRDSIRSRRNEIILAHEESISFLQHLVLLEGGDSDEAPGDSEISLWLAGANGHLARWFREDSESLSDEERLAAELVRISRFSSKPDVLRAVVRTRRIFGRKPSTGSLADEERWNALSSVAFPGGFDAFFETGLGLLAMLANRWGHGDAKQANPLVNVGQFVGQSGVSVSEFNSAVAGFKSQRDDLRAAIARRLRADGLPHSPSALFHTPLVEIEPDILVAASPWAITGLLRTGVWARYLAAAKKIDPRKGADEWLSAFGYMFEDWCRDLAREAAVASSHRAKVILPSKPGASDEIEDIVVVEDGVAVFCSVKGRLMEAKVAREAVSPATVVEWMDKFFFEDKGDEFRGGALRQLSSRIDKLRRGDFEDRGLTRDMPVVPVVVTYDSVGESDIAYRHLESGCKKYGLLQQRNVGPLALARIEDFEQLMSRVRRGKDVSNFLLSRQGVNQYRRLDQLLYEAEPPSPPRLPFFEVDFRALADRIISRY